MKQKPKKLLELFAGSRSIGKVAERRGWRVFSVDIEPFDKIDLVTDIMDLNVRDIPFVPDVIWASPPCTTFSVMSLARHWTHEGMPKTDKAIHGLEMVKRTIRVIQYFMEKNPKLIFYIENPRGKLRSLLLFRGLRVGTVSYCKYGDIRMKPTDIWTNNLYTDGVGWKPRKMCTPGNPDCHHEQCKPTNQCGTHAMKNAYERSKIPTALAREILDAVK
jgi:site-specific DNA-cytosine methylase